MRRTPNFFERLCIYVVSVILCLSSQPWITRLGVLNGKQSGEPQYMVAVRDGAQLIVAAVPDRALHKSYRDDGITRELFPLGVLGGLFLWNQSYGCRQKRKLIPLVHHMKRGIGICYFVS